VAPDTAHPVMVYGGNVAVFERRPARPDPAV